MIFPFEITRHYTLSNDVFGRYSTSEIIDFLYEYLYKEEFMSIEKKDNEIELTGDRDKWVNHINWSRTDSITHCIDFGKIEIINSSGKRILVYTYRIKRIVLGTIPSILFFPLLYGLISWSFSAGLTTLWLILGIIVLFWIFLLLIHPWTIEAPIEIMRINSIRDRIKKQNN